MEPESIKVQVEGQGQDLKVAFAVGQQALKDEVRGKCVGVFGA